MANADGAGGSPADEARGAAELFEDRDCKRIAVHTVIMPQKADVYDKAGH